MSLHIARTDEHDCVCEKKKKQEESVRRAELQPCLSLSVCVCVCLSVSSLETTSSLRIRTFRTCSNKMIFSVNSVI